MASGQSMASGQEVSPETGGPLPLPRSAPRRPSAKLVLAGAIIVSLVGVLAFALVRETAAPARASGVASRPSLQPPRAALTKAEEAYAHALWGIHSEVKGGAYQMTFGGLKYALGQIDAAELTRRVGTAAEIFGRAEAGARSLAPPPSLGAVHTQYLEAIALFGRSAAEMLRVSEDGRHAHLVAAYPLGEEASRKLLQVGDAIWPGEYLPN